MRLVECSDDHNFGQHRLGQGAETWDDSGMMASIALRPGQEVINFMFFVFVFIIPAYHPKGQALSS